MSPPSARSKKRAHPHPTNPRPPPSKRPKTSVSLDSLRWKPVDMPDRLDDVEGFFGLEEVEGVDVERGGDGAVEYKVVGGGKERKKGEKGKKKATVVLEGEGLGAIEGEEGEEEGESKKTRRKSKKNGRTHENKIEVEEEKEEGEEERGEELPRPKKSEAKKQKPKKLKKKKQPKPGNQETSLEIATGNEFALLQDENPEVSLPAWDSLGLSLPTLRALSKLSFTTPTPIQSSAIPEILAGHDLIGKASTGSGKTLAFGIPILESYLSRPPRKVDKPPMALILSPTRELAHQLHAHLTALAAFAPEMSIVAVTGGLSLQKQLRQLKERGGADVIVATPGRLWEVISEGSGWIGKLRSGLRFLVVDEADRLLQEGHFKEVEEVLNLLCRTGDDEESEEDEGEEGEGEAGAAGQRSGKQRHRKGPRKETDRQTLVFSATFHKGLQQKLVGKGGRKALGGDLMGKNESMEYLLKKLKFRDDSPKFVDVNPVGQLAERLKEGIIECGAMEKDLYLYYLLLRYPSRALIFTNSISAVKRLSPFLTELGLTAHPLHSKMIQKARLRSLERFSAADKPHSILIATDVAARGLDIQNVDMVVHYHLPRTADMYVHRSGRSARGLEASGVSILLCCPDEVLGVRRLVGKVHDTESLSTARYMMRSFNVDRKLVARLKKRTDLAKRIADCAIEKQKKGHEDEWLKAAAEDLGVGYDSDDFSFGGAAAGRKGGQKKRDKAVGASKAQVAAWKAELKAALAERVNAGYSKRYLTSGNVNLAQALLMGGGMNGGFLGLQERSAVDEVGG